MSKHPDDGGRAFPVSLPGFGDNGCDGMSMRQWFAGRALQGMLAHGYHPRDPAVHWHDAIAQEAYELADAMLRWERRERTDPLATEAIHASRS